MLLGCPMTTFARLFVLFLRRNAFLLDMVYSPPAIEICYKFPRSQKPILDPARLRQTPKPKTKNKDVDLHKNSEERASYQTKVEI